MGGNNPVLLGCWNIINRNRNRIRIRKERKPACVLPIGWRLGHANSQILLCPIEEQPILYAFV